jgi:hypothetical protein
MTDDLDSVALTIQENHQLFVPLTGELVDLRQPNQVAQALESVRDAKRQLDHARAFLEDTLRLEAQRQGTKTLHLQGCDAVITGGTTTSYDSEQLAVLLHQAGMPLDRISELIVATVTYKVNAHKAKQAAAANPAYKDAIEQTKTVDPAPWRVAIKRHQPERNTMSETTTTSTTETTSDPQPEPQPAPAPAPEPEPDNDEDEE